MDRLETAAAARSADLGVTVLEMGELPLLRVLGPEVAQLFADLHTRHGVDMRFGVQITQIVGEDGSVTGVALADGTTIPAGTVVVGVGITPNVGLAEAAGLDVGDGIIVDQHLRSSDPDIFAAGDVACLPPRLGPARARRTLGQRTEPARGRRRVDPREDVAFDRSPYFFTDQYDLGMEYTGHVEPGDYDTVVFRGDPASGEYIAFWTKDARVLAGMNVNIWDVTDDIKALVQSGRQVDLEALADPARTCRSLPLVDQSAGAGRAPGNPIACQDPHAVGSFAQRLRPDGLAPFRTVRAGRFFQVPDWRFWTRNRQACPRSGLGITRTRRWRRLAVR